LDSLIHKECRYQRFFSGPKIAQKQYPWIR
jgi:hypothetical protein